MAGVVWEKPPPEKSSTQVAAERLAREVASRPGEWALIATYPRTKAGRASSQSRKWSIVKGLRVSWNEVGKFDAIVRSTPDGYKLYVKCVHRNEEYPT